MSKSEAAFTPGLCANYNWDHLRYFLAVARTGTLTAAAELLGTDHTTISRRVARLEEEVSVKLFQRSNLGYTLTPAGQRLHDAARKIEQNLLEGISSAQTDHGALSGKVRIGAPDGVGGRFLAAHLPALQDANPDLELELIATARFFDVTTGEADIAVSVSMPRLSRLVFRRLTDYTLLAYGSRDYLAAHPPICERRELEKHRFIGYVERELYAPELNYLGSISPNLDVRFRSTNILAQVHATLAGRGLCILPAFIAADYPELRPVLPDSVRLQRAYFIQTHEDRRETPLIRQVIDFIVERAAEARDLFVPPCGATAGGGAIRPGNIAQRPGGGASTSARGLTVVSS